MAAANQQLDSSRMITQYKPDKRVERKKAKLQIERKRMAPVQNAEDDTVSKCRHV